MTNKNFAPWNKNKEEQFLIQRKIFRNPENISNYIQNEIKFNWKQRDIGIDLEVLEKTGLKNLRGLVSCYKRSPAGFLSGLEKVEKQYSKYQGYWYDVMKNMGQYMKDGLSEADAYSKATKEGEEFNKRYAVEIRKRLRDYAKECLTRYAFIHYMCLNKALESFGSQRQEAIDAIISTISPKVASDDDKRTAISIAEKVMDSYRLCKSEAKGSAVEQRINDAANALSFYNYLPEQIRAKG